LKQNLVKRQSRLKVFNILAIPSPSYGCEMWTLHKMYMRSLKTVEIKFMRLTAR